VNSGDGSLTIVIPCFNESLNLEILIKQLEVEVGRKNFKIILVDNGSTDDSAFTISQCFSVMSPTIRKNFHSIHLKDNLNYGGGIKSGLRVCKSEFVGWFHADLQFEAAEISKLADHLDQSVVLVKGLRKSRPLIERIFTGSMSIFTSALYQRFCRDVNGQPTIFRRDFLINIEEAPDDFSFDAYFYLQAKISRVSIKRVSVHMMPRLNGTSSWNSGLNSQLKFSTRTLQTLIKMRLKTND
jgi:glycosyltransferase involved in cell wall biosynthesis